MAGATGERPLWFLFGRMAFRPPPSRQHEDLHVSVVPVASGVLHGPVRFCRATEDVTFGGAVVPRTAVRERPLHWVASPEGAGGATGSGRGREPAAGSFSRFLPAAAGSRARAPARARGPLLHPSGYAVGRRGGCRRPCDRGWHPLARVPTHCDRNLSRRGPGLALGTRPGLAPGPGWSATVRGPPHCYPRFVLPAEALPIPYGRSDANKTMGWSATVRGPPHCYPRFVLPAEALPIPYGRSDANKTMGWFATVRGPPHCYPRFVLPAEALPIPYGRSDANKTMGWSATVRGPPHCYPRFVLPAEALPIPYGRPDANKTMGWSADRRGPPPWVPGEKGGAGAGAKASSRVVPPSATPW